MGAERGDRGQQVLKGASFWRPQLESSQIKIFRSGAFRWIMSDKRVVHQPVEQGLVYFTGHGHKPALVVSFLSRSELLYQLVDQAVARAGIKGHQVVQTRARGYI